MTMLPNDPLAILLPALILFAGMAASRRLNERALGSLEAEQREAALRAVATMRRYALAAVMLIALVGVVTSTYWLGLGGVAAYFVFVSFESARRLRPLVPAAEIRLTLLARGVVLLALAASIALFVLLH